MRSQYAARERQIDLSDETALKSELADIEVAKNQDYTSKWYKRLERAWDSGDLETYERVEKEMETQRKRVKYILDNLNRRYNDDFMGQFGASYRAGRISQDEALAWNEYLKNPTLPNREYAESVSDTLNRFRKNNEATLAEDAAAPWLSQTLAGNLPQLTDQLKAGVAGAAGTGLTSGFIAAASGNPFVSGTAALKGAKVGYAAATAAHSYDVMRGAAYRNLLAKGMDEKSARAAANDEALVSSLVELADTGVDINTVFDAITSPQKAGAKGVLKLLAKMGVNIALNSAGEGAQEGLQESVSIANEQRNGTGIFNLAGEAAGTLGDAILAKDPQARQRILSAMEDGAKLSLMTAAPAIIAVNTPHIVDAAMTPESLQTILDASDKNTLSKREYMLSQTTNPRVRNAVNQLYRPGATTGDGGTADAIRHERLTGSLLYGRSHLQKGQDWLRALKRIQENEVLTAKEKKILEELIDDLEKALGGE